MIASKFRKFLEKGNLSFQPHQLDGVEWCLKRELDATNTEATLAPIRGGILADEMGLGKTIMMLGTIMLSKSSNKQVQAKQVQAKQVQEQEQPTLIVLPPALLMQWKRAISEITPELSCLVYHSGHDKDIDLKIARDLEQYDIVLTTYGHVVVRTISILSNVKWHRIIFDEAHHLRHRKSQRAQMSHPTKLNSDIRWLITGTPIQNGMWDFYSLCEQLSIPSKIYKKKDNFEEIKGTYILKRTKKEVNINIPPKEERMIQVKWGDKEEQNISEQIHSLIPGITNTYHRDVYPEISKITDGCRLAALIRARQMCVYPELLSGLLTDNMIVTYPTDIERVEKMLKATKETSKINAIVKHISETDMRKKLIFCHFKKEIDRIQEKIEEECPELIVEVLDGRTTHDMRNDIIENPDIDILILQIQTGCEGLNLQHYSDIYFVSPHWNPSVEDQAVARAHRLGQTKSVNVYRFVMEDPSTRELDTRELDTEKEASIPSINIETYCLNVQSKKREIHI